ncbi:TonB-dependent receptor [Sphingomonas sp. R1]|uniref:TonB-dependent receptor n=1 Tax=Sphingomonas sp. R1 TaxID=399176 RepID=UPI002225A635|nr:TonB-dependent receptor [Sphingomonas sp. R1]UYY76779.1 TonB-dependent receptor [Sphingomonas sp. R1]
MRTASLRAGASLATLSVCAAPGLARAQTVPAPGDGAVQAGTATSDGQTGDAQIIVTGIRASLQGARDRKRSAEQVIDSITAQDIGALPDRSVSEALQRVPGVTLQRTNQNRDPARLSAEGGGVFIRGLSWVRSELNGRDVFSASNGRGLSFEDVSADLLSGVDVYKNPSADLVEGGVGGSINLRTRKPFDAKGYVFAASGDANYADLRKNTYYSGNALASGRWQTPLGEVGLLVSYLLSNVGNRTNSVQTDKYSARTLSAAQDGLSAGSTVYVPGTIGVRQVDWQQKRTAFDSSLQWRPSDTLEFTFEVLAAKATPKDIEHAVGDNDTLPTDDASYTFGANNALTSGTLTNRRLNFDTRYGTAENQTQDYSGKVRWTPNEHWSFSADLQYVHSTAKSESLTVYTETSTPATIAFDLSGDVPKLSIASSNGASLSDKSAYWWYAAMDHIEDNEAHQWAGKADGEYSFTDSDFLKSFRFGGRITDRTAITRQTGWNWSLLSAAYWGGGTPVALTATGYTGGVQNAGLPSQSTLFNYSNFFSGNVSTGSGFWFPSASLVSNGRANAYSYLKSTESAGWGWAPISDDYAQAKPGSDNVTGGVNDQTERTFAGYGLLRFGMDQSAIGQFDGNVGVRVVRTETGASGAAMTVASITSGTCTVGVGGATADDCALFAKAVAFSQGSTTQAGESSSGSYTDVLPSLNLRFFLKEGLQLRLAAAKAIVRPTFAQLNPFTTLSFSFDSNGKANGVGLNGQTTAFTGTAGNPNLKPTRSNQFDASLEWYFGRANSLTLAAFYKDISDYIFAGVTQRSYTSGGQTITFDVTQQMNGAHGTIKGFELGYTQFFDRLPGALGGLGLTGNYTFVDSSGGKNTAVNVFDANQTSNATKPLPLEGLSRYSYNVAVVYEKYGISARAAYNWRSTYLLTTSAANLNYPVWSEGYGQLDGSILYSLTRHVKIGVQGTNLLKAKTYLDVGDADLKPRYSWTSTDRRIAFLLRTSF